MKLGIVIFIIIVTVSIIFYPKDCADTNPDNQIFCDCKGFEWTTISNSTQYDQTMCIGSAERYME